MADQTDRRLLSAIQAGRREACAELVQGHYAAVYRFLLHLSRDADEAEDLTQETFATAWQKIGGFEGRCALGTWLHRIAYGKFVDARRAARRTAVVVERLANQAAPVRPPGPLDRVMAGDQARQLYAALQELEPRDRLLLVLHYLQGLSYREMATVVDEPAGTLKWRTSLALGRLRALLPAEDHDHDQPQSAREKLDD